MERPRRPGPLGPRTLPTKRNSSSVSALSRAGSTRSVGSLNLDAIPVRRSLDEEVQSGEEMTTAPTTEANLTTTTTTTTETSLNPPNQDPEHSSPPPPSLSLQNSPLVLEDPQPLSPTKTRREEVEASQSFVLPEEPEEEEEEEEEEMPHRESLPPPPPSKSPPPLSTLTIPPLPNFGSYTPSDPTSPSSAPTPATSLLPSHYKALPYEAAQWTFTSTELQDIVSRAIRLSARESFVRLLSLKLLDTILPDELEKLAEKRRGVGGRYRFTVQRRSMLMQGLWAVVASPDLSSANTPTSSITPAATSLLTQLSDASAECDRMAEDLVKICDQVKEIHQLVDGHWASALAVALRKLNSSYAKRTTEVLTARDRIHQLEAERDDAWKEAESVAKNLDTMEAEFKRVSAELVKLTGVQDELKKAEEEILRLEEQVRRLSDVEEEVRDLRERVKNVKVKARSRSQSRSRPRTKTKEEEKAELERERQEWEAAVEARARLEKPTPTPIPLPLPIPSSVSIPPLTPFVLPPTPSTAKPPRSPAHSLSPTTPKDKEKHGHGIHHITTGTLQRSATGPGPASAGSTGTFGMPVPLPLPEPESALEAEAEEEEEGEEQEEIDETVDSHGESMEPGIVRRASVVTFGPKGSGSGSGSGTPVRTKIAEEEEEVPQPPKAPTPPKSSTPPFESQLHIHPSLPTEDPNSDSDSDSDSDSLLEEGEEILIQTAEVVSVQGQTQTPGVLSPRASFGSFQALNTIGGGGGVGGERPMSPTLEKPKLVTLPSSPTLTLKTRGSLGSFAVLQGAGGVAGAMKGMGMGRSVSESGVLGTTTTATPTRPPAPTKPLPEVPPHTPTPTSATFGAPKPPPQAPTPMSVHGHEYEDLDEPAVDSDAEEEYQAILSQGAGVAGGKGGRVERMGPFKLSLTGSQFTGPGLRERRGAAQTQEEGLTINTSPTQRLSRRLSSTSSNNPPPFPPPAHPIPPPPVDVDEFPVPPSSPSPVQLQLQVPGSPTGRTRSKRYSHQKSPLVSTFSEAQAQAQVQARLPEEEEEEGEEDQDQEQGNGQERDGEGEEEPTTPTQASASQHQHLTAFPSSSSSGSRSTSNAPHLTPIPTSPSKRTHLEGVTAARKRSIRASQGALRLPEVPAPRGPVPLGAGTGAGGREKMYLHTNTGLGVNLSVPLPYSPTQEHPYSLRERERERVPSNNSSSGAEGGREAGGSGSGSGGGRERERERTTSLGAGPSGSVSKSQRTLLGTRPPPLSNSRTLRPIAMDDMVLTPTPTSSHGHGHEYAEEEEEERERERKERERMNRRGSVDEVSLVANTRRRNAELDDDVPPLPSEGQSSSASVTYYSFPNGSSGSAKPGRSIPSMWLGAETRGGGGGGGGGGLEREGSKKVRFNTTSSGGLMHMTEGGAGAGNGGGLLNSGIQKWKSMLMNQRRKSELAASLRANAGVGGREGGGSGRFSFSSRD